MSTLVKTFNATAALRSLALTPRLEWTAPSSLWSDYAGQNNLSPLRQPALLRFASDNFIEDLQAILAEKPETLKEQVAKPESFAEPFSSVLGMTRPVPSQLKLYQPAHGHFYLVAANLICRQTTLPDRTVNAGSEKVGFVLRRLSANQEMAWVNDGEGKVWQALTSPLELSEIEEVFPMFPLSYCDEGQKRRLWAGLVPTSSRETFKASGVLSPYASQDDDDAVKDRIEQARELVKDLRPDLTEEGKIIEIATRWGDPRRLELDGRVLKRYGELKELNQTPPQVEEVSAFLLLDLAEWLMTHAKDFWNKLQTNSLPTSAEDPGNLYPELGKNLDGSLTWIGALKQVVDPNNLAAIYNGSSSLKFNLRNSVVDAATLRKAALDLPLSAAASGPSTSNTTTPASVEVAKLESLDSSQIPEYVLRCVYLRPNCPTVVSESCPRFTIAAFFDPDAPSRPVRITLPDTNLSSLRKYRKNVSFRMSKELRKQVQQVSDAKEALTGNLSEGTGFNLGVICSFSIPIITICAFIVLMIFLILLNMVFWWLPFFRICFPIKR